MSRRREEEIREVAARMADLMDQLEAAVDAIRARPPAPASCEACRDSEDDEGGTSDGFRE